jgi:hypothetical protein
MAHLCKLSEFACGRGFPCTPGRYAAAGLPPRTPASGSPRGITTLDPADT